MGDVRRRFATMVGFAFRADPWRAAALVVLNLIAPFSWVLSAYWLKLLADAAVGQDPGSVATAAVGLGVTGAVGMLTRWATTVLAVPLMENTGRFIDRRLIELTVGIPGLVHHERPDYLDRLALVRDDRFSLSTSFLGFVMSLGVVVELVGAAGLLAGVSPWLMLLPLFGTPSVLTTVKSHTAQALVEEKTTVNRRRAAHLFDLATSAGPAKEMRIFGLGSEMVDRQRQQWTMADSALDRVAVRTTLLVSLGWLGFALGYVGAVLLVVARAVNGSASPGDVVLVVRLAGQVNQQVSQAVGTFTWFLDALKTTERYLWLSDFAAEQSRSPQDPAPVPERLAHGIDFDHVTFRYPGTETDVLEDACLHLPPGSTVALVGENGAGKTTLVKLLCGFYQPTSGAVAVDGVDLARFDIGQWRRALSAGFQDFARFELLARHVVGIGQLEQRDDEAAVGGALERAAAGDLPGDLVRGLDTQLGRSFDAGVELSGGQWQKLALGRAMMRRAPLLLVLDEPTASLDAETEHALFQRFSGAASEVSRATGAITVLVSHRFSTVRMADLIVVVDGGRIRDVGTHDELVARGGLYAELYELQARSYR